MEFVQHLVSGGRDIFSALFIHQLPKVIVKNLPEIWTNDELQFFFEKEIGLLKVKDNGIHTFGNIKHTALICLQNPMTDQSLRWANEDLRNFAFSAHVLQLEAVENATSSLLLHYQGLDIRSAHERFSRFLNSLTSNRDDEQKTIEICGVETYDDLSLTVFKFTSSIAVHAFVSDGESHQEQGMVLEPWYKEFHGRLLREMLRHKVARISPKVEKCTLEGIENQALALGEQKVVKEGRENLLGSTAFPERVRVFNLVSVSVPLCLDSAQLRQAKSTLETPYLVTITRIASDTDDGAQIQVDGIISDVELATREVKRHAYLTGRKHFTIHGALEGKACIKWFSTDLDKTKQMILKNEGEIEKEEATSQGYTLVFKCLQEVLEDVVNKLNSIKESIISTTVNLNEKFPVYADRALVVNGLLNMGKDTFCAQLRQKLQNEQLNSMGDFRLPKRCDLPPLGVSRCCRPFHRIKRNTDITVQAGNITMQKVDVAVCPVTRDLNLHKTKYGIDFLKTCPQLQKKLKKSAEHNNIGTNHCVIIVPLKGETTQPCTASEIYSVVLHEAFKDDPNMVFKLVQQLTKHILNLASERGVQSIVFPPLGVGRRFQYEEEVVARAMTSAFSEFLDTNPNSLQNIIVATKNGGVASRFAQMAKLTNPCRVLKPYIPEWCCSAVDPCPEIPETRTEPFEAQIVTPKDLNIQAVSDVLMKELQATFLWHETVNDVENFQTLSSDIHQGIRSEAKKKDVILSMTDKGLRICGQKDKVCEVKLLIRDKMYDLLVQQSKQEREKRQELGLPINTDRLPAYWKMSQEYGNITYEKAMEIWNKQGNCTTPVTREEYAEIEKLVMATWQRDKVGHGRDARDLKHKAVKVLNIQRLENPELWMLYSQKREQLFNGLVDHHNGAGPAVCTPVENLPGSRGPVQTSENIAEHGLLNQDVYTQVNEHYLFHGTKTDVLPKILSQGLDFRLATNAMFGRGVYAAESPTKSDQYADGKTGRTSGGPLQMFLMRMLLGEPFLHTNGQGFNFARPPCRTCFQMHCDCTSSRLFNSVVDDSSRIFREFVVYDQHVCYPEYIVTYKRL